MEPLLMKDINEKCHFRNHCKFTRCTIMTTYFEFSIKKLSKHPTQSIRKFILCLW